MARARTGVSDPILIGNVYWGVLGFEKLDSDVILVLGCVASVQKSKGSTEKSYWRALGMGNCFLSFV